MLPAQRLAEPRGQIHASGAQGLFLWPGDSVTTTYEELDNR